MNQMRTKNKRRLTAQEREDARDIATAKKILRSPRLGKLISESRVLRELGHASKIHR